MIEVMGDVTMCTTSVWRFGVFDAGFSCGFGAIYQGASLGIFWSCVILYHRGEKNPDWL
mgnify:CR=1 FL=1